MPKLSTYSRISATIQAIRNALSKGDPGAGGADADLYLVPSGVAKNALVIQMLEGQTAPALVVKDADGDTVFEIQADGNLVVNQTGGAVSSTPLSVRFQGSEVSGVGYTGALSSVSLNVGGGYFVVDSAGNIDSYGDALVKSVVAGNHGITPLITDDGNADTAIIGADTGAKITVGTGTITEITVTFGQVYAIAPAITVQGSASSGILVSVTETGYTVTRVGDAAFTPGEVLPVVGVRFHPPV